MTAQTIPEHGQMVQHDNSTNISGARQYGVKTTQSLEHIQSVRSGVLKSIVGLLAVCLAAYIVGPPLYWQLMEGFASTSASVSCPACDCDCDSMALWSIPQGLINASFIDCTKHDPEVNEDTQKNFAELLSEELKEREAQALANQQRADMALLEAKKMTSQYQKEADKCNSGMETCEEAREKSEASLLAQKRLTAVWEERARQRGWIEGNAKSKS